MSFIKTNNVYRKCILFGIRQYEQKYLCEPPIKVSALTE